jgi:Ca-activated chloride channel homolog
MRSPLLAVILLLVAPLEAMAQGIIIPRPRPCPPQLECIPAGAQVVRTRSDVRVELVDRVLRFEVEERFVNRGSMIGEADYLFPLPRGAAFQDLALSIDGEMISGETMDAAQARRIYEEIVRQQRDPALVEWMGHGLLRTRIFPIQPGEERRIIVRFQAVAEREGDFLRIDYFRGARTSPQLGGGGWIAETPPGALREAPDRRQERATFTLTYPAGATFGRAYSPTHSIDLTERGGRRIARIEGDASDVTVMVPSRQRTSAAIGALSHAPGRDDGFVLLTIAPPQAESGAPAPRDVVFVVDVSGSMSGGKIVQARAAGRALLETLRPTDRFRIIDFASDVRSFRDDPVFATRENLAAARRYIDRLEAVGGTNISGALDEALRRDAWSGAGDRLGFILFVTDGAPTVGERDPHRIADRVRRARGDRRVFTFGVGSDVNTQLVEQLALEGRGTAHFVRPDESVEHSVSVVAARLRDPVLADARIVVEGGTVRMNRVLPSQPLDIFAGQDLVVLARYSGSGRVRVTVTGRAPRGGAGDARHVRWSSDVVLPARERDNPFVARLWATQRVGWLAAEKRRATGPTAEIDAEIRDLGERYGIPTEFTSYFVKEPGMQIAMPGTPMPATATRGVTTARGAVGNAARQDGAVAPAPSSVAQFEGGRAAAAQRATTSLADLAPAEHAQAEKAAGVRRLGTRAFTRVDGLWTDSRHAPANRILRVKLFSSAYFRIIEEIPELRQYLAAGERMLIAGRGVSLEVGEDGSERLSAEEHSALRAALSDQER